MVQYSLREQEAAQVTAVRLKRSDEDAEKMMQQAGAYLARQSQELQEVVKILVDSALPTVVEAVILLKIAEVNYQ